MSELREVHVDAPPGAPLFGWTPESIKEYIESKPLVEGDMMVIYNGQAGFHRYYLAEVVKASSGRQKRIILSKAGDWGGVSFYRNGKNCFSPTGQSKMLPPIPELTEHLTLECDVVLKERYIPSDR